MVYEVIFVTTSCLSSEVLNTTLDQPASQQSGRPAVSQYSRGEERRGESAGKWWCVGHSQQYTTAALSLAEITPTPS